MLGFRGGLTGACGGRWKVCGQSAAATSCRGPAGCSAVGDAPTSKLTCSGGYTGSLRGNQHIVVRYQYYWLTGAAPVGSKDGLWLAPKIACGWLQRWPVVGGWMPSSCGRFHVKDCCPVHCREPCHHSIRCLPQNLHLDGPAARPTPLTQTGSGPCTPPPTQPAAHTADRPGEMSASPRPPG